jgi:hypothetical protein
LLKLIDALLQSFVREETTSKKMEEKKKITFDVMRIMMMLMMLRRIRKMIEKAPTWTGKIIKFACLIGGAPSIRVCVVESVRLLNIVADPQRDSSNNNGGIVIINNQT